MFKKIGWPVVIMSIILLLITACSSGDIEEAKEMYNSITHNGIKNETQNENQNETQNETKNATISTTQSNVTYLASDMGNKSETSSLKLEIDKVNNWESNGLKYVQLEINISNTGAQEVSDWCVELPTSQPTKVEQVWSTVYTQENNNIFFKAVEYNQKIPPHGSISFGGIVVELGNADLGLAKLTYDKGTRAVSNTKNHNQTNNQEDKKNNNQNNDSTSKYIQPKITIAKDVPPPTNDDWLFTKGNKIVDKNGKEVWLTGINWFGYNTGTNTFDGLWAADLNTSIAAIADRGFNILRVPISSELILQWGSGKAPAANFNQATNSYLVGMDSLQIFDYIVGQCRANGIKIMIDIHSAKTDPMGHMKNVWFDGDISEADFLDSLAWMAERYKNDDTVIAYDLKNEPHGKPDESPRAIWNDSKDPENWKYVAEKAANAVLSKNPNVLILVEGIEIYPKNLKTNKSYASKNAADYYYNWWGGNLRGVKDFPINLGEYQNKLVYSPHDYGPTVHLQPWFKGGYTFESLYKDCWRDNWMYIHEGEIAPLLIGEWGGYMTEPNITWMTHLRKLIKDNKLHHTFWCFNANSGDTGGLVKDDFTTWDEEKYQFVKDVLWQKGGKFVGLDQEIPLGKNGISLKQATK